MKRIRIPDLLLKKQNGEKISVLTAYDANTARLLDCAGVDIVLVGDSAGMVVLGYAGTIPVTLEAMIHHTAAVSRGVQRAVVIADMPFLTYQVSLQEAVRNAGRLLQEGGAAGVKLEGGRPVLDVVSRLTSIGIPVMGHLGLLPQSEHQLGGFRRQATEPDEAERLLNDAIALEQAGAFSIVLESIPSDLAQTVSSRLAIPTIGIGAGPHCDGQVLVIHDLLGLSEKTPHFAKQYARLGEEIVRAARAYIADVQEGRFPPPEPASEAEPD